MRKKKPLLPGRKNDKDRQIVHLWPVIFFFACKLRKHTRTFIVIYFFSLTHNGFCNSFKKFVTQQNIVFTKE